MLFGLGKRKKRIDSLFFSAIFAVSYGKRDNWAQRIEPFQPSFRPPKQSLAIWLQRLILEISGIVRKLGASRLKSVPSHPDPPSNPLQREPLE
jgi:hypothetical protein